MAIRNQLQTLTGAEITGAQITEVGGKVFTNATSAQDDIHALVQFWRSIHAPTYGFPIPGSGTTASGDCSSGTILAPEKNQTAYVTGLSFNNSSATDPAVVEVSIGNSLVWNGVIDPNGADYCIGAAQLQPFFLVQGLDITVEVSGVSPDDVNFSLSYGLSVQG